MLSNAYAIDMVYRAADGGRVSSSLIDSGTPLSMFRLLD